MAWFSAPMSPRVRAQQSNPSSHEHVGPKPMSETAAKIGLGSDLFDTAGRPMFGSAPLALFSDAGLTWSVVPITGGRLPPEAFTDYQALLIGGAEVSDAELGGES